MSTQFEFHLRGADVPNGQLRADHLIAIIQSLKDVAMGIGRLETGADDRGRAPAKVHRVASLIIGMKPGSTTILAQRAGVGSEALDFDLPDEEAFDARFVSLIKAIANDVRPDWVDDSLARAAGQLTSALMASAPRIAFTADGRTRNEFSTAGLRREIWNATAETPTDDEITLVGRLYAANLQTHRYQVQDDVGHQVALPNVTGDQSVRTLLGEYVHVVGTPIFDDRGTLVRLLHATITQARELITSEVPQPIPLEQILQSAPGPDPDDGITLTDEEFDAFWDAIHG